MLGKYFHPDENLYAIGSMSAIHGSVLYGGFEGIVTNFYKEPFEDDDVEKWHEVCIYDMKTREKVDEFSVKSYDWIESYEDFLKILDDWYSLKKGEIKYYKSEFVRI